MPDAPDPMSLDATLRGLAAGQRVFGRYVLARVLGQGGMGVVWLAHDEALEKEVALKFVIEALTRDPEAVANLKRETRRCQDLHHPGIVGIFDLQQDADRIALSMEYVEGRTLSAAKGVQPDMCFAPAEILAWMEQLADVLTYAHEEVRVVHRDLKPANLMLAVSGRLKVMDFGIAHQLSDSLSQRSAQQPTSYTPPFASPQQIMGERAAASDDIYSFGATIYDLITGKPPFYSGKIELQVLQREAPGMAARRAELGRPEVFIPEAWERVIAACLSKDAAARPASAAELARVLRAGFEENVAPEPVAEPPIIYEAAVPVAVPPDIAPRTVEPTAVIEVERAPAEPVEEVVAQFPTTTGNTAGRHAARFVRTFFLVLLLAAGTAWALRAARHDDLLAKLRSLAKTGRLPSASPTPSTPSPEPPEQRLKRHPIAAAKQAAKDRAALRITPPPATPLPATPVPAETGKPFKRKAPGSAVGPP